MQLRFRMKQKLLGWQRKLRLSVKRKRPESPKKWNVDHMKFIQLA